MKEDTPAGSGFLQQIVRHSGEPRIPDELTWQELPYSKGRKDALISTTVLNGFRELVAQVGGDADSILDSLGINLEAIGEKILFRDFALLLEVTAETTECPDFGMRLGHQQDWSKLVGQLELLLKSAETFEDVINYYTRHKHVYCSAVQLHLEPCARNERQVLRFEILADDTPLRRQVMEFLLSVCHKSKHYLFSGAVRSREVWFSHS